MPVEAAPRSAEYVFQGTMYFYRREKILCRYQLCLRDAVEPALLQKALDTALAKADFYRVRLVWDKRDAFLEPNPNLCTVYAGSALRDIPEQTNDYLFSVSCEGSTLFFDWYHFLMDGRGVSPLLTLLLAEYCRLRYGCTIDCPPPVSAPAYDIRALIDRFPEQVDQQGDFQREVLQTCEGAMRRTRVRLDKKSLVDAALRCGVKPFSALSTLLCQAMRLYFEKDEILCSFTVDTRKAMGVPDALYNCVASFQQPFTMTDADRLADLAGAMDAAVQHSLTPEAAQRQMATQMGWVYKVSQQKAPLKIKQRLFQMGEYLGGIPADLWISYLGSPLTAAGRALEEYITDFQVWVPPDTGSLGVEAVSLHGAITLCIENKSPTRGLSRAIRTAFEREGVRVLEACDLDEEA